VRASGTLDERLRAHVQPTVLLKSRQEAPLYTLIEAPAKAVVEEPQSAGEARVECTRCRTAYITSAEDGAPSVEVMSSFASQPPEVSQVEIGCHKFDFHRPM
jgi:hypothetical protein